MWIIIIFVIGGFATFLIYGSGFPSEGSTKGRVTKVEVELHESHQNRRRHMQMNVDPRSYRIHVKYLWKGQEYEAKSFAAYSMTKYFPGDEVTIMVNKNDKSIVKIVE